MRTSSANLATRSNSVERPDPMRNRVLVRKSLIQYGIALVAVAVAWLARSLLSPILGAEASYLFFVPAVLVAAGFGGIGPGLIATVLATVLGFLVSTAHPSFSPADIINAVIFALVGEAARLGPPAAS